MPTDPAYRTYLAPGARQQNQSDSHPTPQNTTRLRVLLQPESKTDDFTLELAFGAEADTTPFVRLNSHFYAKLINALSRPASLPTQYTVNGQLFPEETPARYDRAGLESITLGVTEYTLPRSNRTGLTFAIPPQQSPVAQVELTPAQRTDLLSFLQDQAVTIYNQRPSSATIVSPAGDTTTVPLGKLHSSHYDLHDEFKTES